MKFVYIKLVAFAFFLIVQKSIAQDILPQDSIWKDLIIDDLVVTAQYAPTHSKNAIHTVRVITAEEIRRQGQNNLSEVLSNQLNMRITTDPILGYGLRIQGIGGENVQVMIDGVPVIGRLDGNIDLSQIMLHQIDRIEIIEGALSSQYGSNASGGVINLISKKRRAEKLYVESQNIIENVGIQNNSLGLGFRKNKLSGNISGSRINYQFSPDDSLRLTKSEVLPSGQTVVSKKTPWNPKLQWGIDGNIHYTTGDSFKIQYQHRRFNEELRMLGEVRRPQFKPYALDEVYTTDRVDHSLVLEAYPSKWLYLSTTTAYNTFDRTKEAFRRDFNEEEDLVTPNFADGDTTSFNSLLNRTILSTVFKSKINAQLGFEYLRETGTGRRILDTLIENSSGSKIENFAGWLGVIYEPLDDLKMMANLRYGHITKFDHPLVPSLNLHWRATPRIDIRGGYAYGFRAPSSKEMFFNFVDVNHYIIGNPYLEAEFSQNANLSFDWKLMMTKKHKLDLNGRVFYNHIKNRIVLALYKGTQYSYQNIDFFESNGFNLGLNYSLKKWLTVKSGFAFTNLHNQYYKEGNGNKFIPSPEWRNEVNILLPYINSNLLITQNAFNRQLRYYFGTDGVVSEGFVEGYNMINATLSRSFWKNQIFLSAGVKNILDVQNIQVEGSNGGVHNSYVGSQLIGWGRTYFVCFNFNFGIK